MKPAVSPPPGGGSTDADRPVFLVPRSPRRSRPPDRAAREAGPTDPLGRRGGRRRDPRRDPAHAGRIIIDAPGVMCRYNREWLIERLATTGRPRRRAPRPEGCGVTIPGNRRRYIRSLWLCKANRPHSQTPG